MSGGYYIALSGMRTRLDQLDRLSEDLANAGTAGFKGERFSSAAVERPSFDVALETAIDVSLGKRRLDMRRGTVIPTNRSLDLAVQSDGFLVVETAQGTRYTRNGQLSRGQDGTLRTADGAAVVGEDGPIKLGPGKVQIEDDGTVRVGKEEVGRISVVRFADAGQLLREGGALLRAPDGVAPEPIEGEVVKAGAIEQSNVMVVERLGELTAVARNFEALQRAVSVLMNDVDGRSIETLGRR